jgi:uncharacterized protein YraI
MSEEGYIDGCNDNSGGVNVSVTNDRWPQFFDALSIGRTIRDIESI